MTRWVARSAFVLLTALAALGCSAGRGSTDGGMPAPLPDLLPDAAADIPASPDRVETVLPDIVVDFPPAELPPEVDVGPCGPSCPEGYCDGVTGQCFFCDESTPCVGPGLWCKDSACVKTLCVPGSTDCPLVDVSAVCADDGESWIDSECQEGTKCAQGTCKEVVCTPGDQHCEQGLVAKCDPLGVGWMTFACPPGQGCFVDQCEPIRHNLLVIFDTSGSMASMGFMDTVPCICATCSSKPFPACEDPLCPQSKLGLSKYVFNKFFGSDKIQTVNMVLTHFPMRVKATTNPSCGSMFNPMSVGWYGLTIGESDWITGDDGSHVTEDGGWFDKYVYEILSVPFPATWEEDNFDELKLWVNFEETVAATEAACQKKEDCPGGFCGQGEGGTKVCWFHTDPELRALSNTPLGKSMFYAGEIYRKQMMPNGKPCTVDADCANRNYHCSSQGVCRDPYAHCRANQILLFTDGVEEPPTTTGSFFNPRIQAKRFRYGLGCVGPEGCFEGAQCQGNVCQGYPLPNGGGGGYPMLNESPSRLLDYEGYPILVTTHVIDLSAGEGAANNKQIADDGGGIYYHPDQIDPDELLAQMMELLDIKQNLLDCMPEYEEVE
ncbi:MAG: hypothetical protein FJ109_10355 [Deltaproteobacteria bacterium]|nr:hypothetical protein [Deltaproteobacteria bacterium]